MSQRRKTYEYDSDDIDSTVTPINPTGDSDHGQVVESDSLSDFYPHDATKKQSKGHHRGHRTHKHSRGSDDPTRGSRGLHLEDHSELLSSFDEGHTNPSKNNMKGIYKELQNISLRLKEENKILSEREHKLRDRERMVSISSANIETITEHAIKQKIHNMQERHKEELSKVEQALRDKTKENKRLKDNFETLKQANDILKKEFEALQAQHDKLEKQTMSVQSRLINLQRKQEFEERQKEVAIAVPKQKSLQQNGEDKTKPSKSQKPLPTSTFDVLGLLLDWICDAYLRHTVTEQPTKPSERYSSTDYVQEKVLRVLPLSVDLLKEFPGINLRISLPCIQFIYWSLVHVEQGPGTQKSSLSSTLRRLGEEMYRSKTVRFSEGDKGLDIPPLSPRKQEKNKDGIYFRSTNLHVRLLSSLIILKTLSQVDLLAHVFDVMKNDLKSDIAKELYLYYQATPVVLQFLKPVNKAFMSAAMDVFLQMSLDSPFQQPFLESCSNESWFRTIAMVLRAPSQDYKLLEKLSIILQRLSKMRCNRKFFEVYTIVAIIQELLRGCATDQAFLALNLKSILFNLNSESQVIGTTAFS